MNAVKGVRVPDVELQLGEQVELWILQTDDKETYASRIEGVEGAMVTVAAPMRKLELVRIPVGGALSLRVPRHDGIFSVVTSVQEVEAEPVPLLHMRMSPGWTREQRRSNVRLDVSIVPRGVTLVLPTVRREVNLMVRSISAGGVLMVSKRQDAAELTDIGPRADLAVLREFQKSAELLLRLPLNGEVLTATALISRVQAVEEAGTFQYRLAARFASLDEKQEEAIFRFIFDEQLKLRRYT